MRFIVDDILDQVLADTVGCSVDIGETKCRKYGVLRPRWFSAAQTPEENGLPFRRKPPIPVEHFSRRRCTPRETQNRAASSLFCQKFAPPEISVSRYLPPRFQHLLKSFFDLV